ncbi:thioesterase II family protein [Streptomyces sp. NBC_01264]|uniref:thioesterase II family protein n=1 Tax=Streptomyces sp. NBC_01264 TaxID=2903804 RepID=UPI00224C867D|nr:alpha/beta fold hydrolase [Streptomyces sp. NBC_01264]MCX4778460.1 alpha/beta fold hydrolase [Streptomyces sp. NBC_01264]
MPETYIRTGNSSAPVRFLAFHHAGGSASSFLPVAQKLQDSCESVLFELAGREPGEEAVRARSFKEALERLQPDVEALVDRPVVVMGHSLGALFAYAAVQALGAEKRSLVTRVVVSSSRSARATADSATMPSEPFVVRNHEQLLAALHAFGGCPPEMFEDEEFLDYALSLLGHDLHLADTFSQVDQEEWMPLEVWYGMDDNTLIEKELTSWQNPSATPAPFRGFPGGHFYVYERPEPARALRELIEVAVGAR